MRKIILFVAVALAATTAIAVRWGNGAQSLPAIEQSRVVQDKCEFDADLAFREWLEKRKAEAAFWDEDVGKLTANYHSYFSPTLHHCLMLIEETASSERGVERVSFIVDLTKQHEYAFYLANKNEVVVCELKPTAHYETFCKTRSEFDDFVAAYMGE